MMPLILNEAIKLSTWLGLAQFFINEEHCLQEFHFNLFKALIFRSYNLNFRIVWSRWKDWKIFSPGFILSPMWTETSFCVTKFFTTTIISNCTIFADIHQYFNIQIWITLVKIDITISIIFSSWVIKILQSESLSSHTSDIFLKCASTLKSRTN